MRDLNYKPSVASGQCSVWEPEEIVCAALALIIWIPMAFIIGGMI